MSDSYFNSEVVKAITEETTANTDQVPSHNVVSGLSEYRDMTITVNTLEKEDKLLLEYTQNEPLHSISVIKRACDVCGETLPLPVTITVLDTKPDVDEPLTIDSIPTVIDAACEKRIS